MNHYSVIKELNLPKLSNDLHYLLFHSTSSADHLHELLVAERLKPPTHALIPLLPELPLDQIGLLVVHYRGQECAETAEELKRELSAFWLEVEAGEVEGGVREGKLGEREGVGEGRGEVGGDQGVGGEVL